jgi:putative protein-disulfide isomerase
MKKVRLYYIYDALCGWCYGFSPIIKKFGDEHREEFTINVLSGGMISGDRIGPIGEVAPYIKTAYKDVENACQVKFGQAFLKDVLEPGDAVFTSIPACKAMVAFKQIAPEYQIGFAHTLQKAIYYDGLLPGDESIYPKLAALHKVDEATFSSTYHSEKTKEAMQFEFDLIKSWGVQGFPTVVLEKDEKLIAITRGFISYAQLETQYQKALHTYA